MDKVHKCMFFKVCLLYQSSIILKTSLWSRYNFYLQWNTQTHEVTYPPWWIERMCTRPHVAIVRVFSIPISYYQTFECSEGLRWVCLHLIPDVKVLSEVPILRLRPRNATNNRLHRKCYFWIAILEREAKQNVISQVVLWGFFKLGQVRYSVLQKELGVEGEKGGGRRGEQ